MIDTAAVNAQIDLQAIAESAGATFKKNRCACPVHGGSNPTSFEIFDSGRAWKCHSRVECNRYGHDGIALLRALNNWTFQEAVAQFEKPIDPKEAAERAARTAERITRELQEKIEQAQRALEELQKAGKWLQYHNNLNDYSRAMWRFQGIPDEWQDFWKLGYSSACPTYRQSPSMTIPIYAINEDEPINIRHRLINPPTPYDKYRPETAGLASMPFYADMTLPLSVADRVIVVEGEKKAAVLYLTLDRALWQVIGIPGKQSWGSIAPLLEGRKDTVIVFDPDAKLEAVQMARSIGGARVVDLPEKLDDMIVNYQLDNKWAESILNNARKI